MPETSPLGPRWSFIFDAISEGRPLKAISMYHEFTRENPARRLGRLGGPVRIRVTGCKTEVPWPAV